MTSRTGILLSLVLYLSGCSGNHPPGIPIPADRFEGIYLDLLTEAGRAGDTISTPVQRPSEVILSKWGVTEEQYRQTVAYYNRNPGAWREFFAGVIRKGEEDAAKVPESQSSRIKDQE